MAWFGAMAFVSTGGSGSGSQREFPGRGAVALMIVVFFALQGLMFAREEQRRLSDPVLKGQRGEITYRSPESLLQEQNIAKALKLIEGAVPKGSVVQSLRLTPVDINATLAERNGREHRVSVDLAFKLSEQTGNAERPTGPKFSEIDPARPAKLIATAQSKLGLQPKDLDYVLLQGSSDPPTWGIYYSEPPLDNDAIAEFDGSDLRIIGTPSAKVRKAQRDAERAAEQARQDFQRRMQERTQEAIQQQLKEAMGR